MPPILYKPRHFLSIPSLVFYVCVCKYVCIHMKALEYDSNVQLHRPLLVGSARGRAKGKPEMICRFLRERLPRYKNMDKDT